jgi:hypothetical protein
MSILDDVWKECLAVQLLPQDLDTFAVKQTPNIIFDSSYYSK